MVSDYYERAKGIYRGLYVYGISWQSGYVYGGLLEHQFSEIATPYYTGSN